MPPMSSVTAGLSRPLQFVASVTKPGEVIGLFKNGSLRYEWQGRLLPLS